MTRGARVFSALVALVLAAGPAYAESWDHPAYPSDQSSTLRLLNREQIDGRMIDLTFQTPYVAGPTKVRVVLPSHYDPSGRTRYPVLWLLHGASVGTPGSTYQGTAYATWTQDEHAEALTAGLPLILVCPDSGGGGGYVDWLNSGAFGQPAWEAYHLNQLLPWIDKHFPTIARRSSRAVAGLSMGGYGAMEYAARRPDLFSAAAAFSGAVDVTNPYMQLQGEAGYSPSSNAYGLYPVQLTYLHARNPTDLAENLAGLTLVQRTGNGSPGGPDGNSFDPVELDVHEQNLALDAQLRSLGISHLFDDYGPGGHEAYYWTRDLKQTLPIFMQAFAHPPRPPVPFSYRSMDPEFAVYGWTVAMSRAASEFAELRDASPHGFQLRGSGSATVTTGRYFQPNAPIQVMLLTASGTLRRLARSDRHGRISLELRLGPSNTADEYSPQAQVADALYGLEDQTDSYSPTTALGSQGTVVYTAAVTFRSIHHSRRRDRVR
jgi:S-formylglutathione hydrolase FrmB